MSIALQWGYGSTPSKSKGFLYFDAVTGFDEVHQGQVTKHPVDNGGSISDHFTRENVVYQITAVLSGVDISIFGVDIEDDEGNKPQNRKDQRAVRDTAVKVKNQSKNALTKLLPDSIGQFFKPSKPEIDMPAQEADTIQTVKDTLRNLFAKNKVTLVNMYEYYGSKLTGKPVKNLVMTNLSFTESPDGGDGVYCRITLEQITFTSSKKEQVPSSVRESLNAKGAQDSTIQEGASDASTNSIQCRKDTGLRATVGYSEEEIAALKPCSVELAEKGFDDQMSITPLKPPALISR